MTLWINQITKGPRQEGFNCTPRRQTCNIQGQLASDTCDFYLVISSTVTTLQMQMIPGNNFRLISFLSFQGHTCSVSKSPWMKSWVNIAGRDACPITYTFANFQNAVFLSPF